MLSGSLNEPKSEGVLLYYKYVSIPDVLAVVKWYEDLCLQLELVGRIRVSPEGVNVTIGGSTKALKEHIYAVSNHPSLGTCDFKVATCKEPLLANPVLVEGCGFDSLSVRAIQELVSLGRGASHVSHAEAGVHLSPTEFHEHLLAASRGQIHSNELQHVEKQPIVVLDARNVYETRIGRFRQIPGTEFLNPCIRQFSELPAWLDAHEEQLRHKQVFMYCTGGVRCERASAYLRSKGPAFQSVYQLSGGIQRYLEAFPDGGLFAGKNFVFDPRVAVGSCDERKVGRCLLCSSLYDDYSLRCRCSRCRLLVLVCDACQKEKASEKVVCELCRKDGPAAIDCGVREDGEHVRSAAEPQAEQADETGSLRRGDSVLKAASNGQARFDEHRLGEGGASENRRKGVLNTKEKGRSGVGCTTSERTEREGPRRLRVLCLHGFRQTGRGLKGRLAAFQRGLKDLADFVFVDAPHQLPCVYYAKGGGESWQGQTEDNDGREAVQIVKAEGVSKRGTPGEKRERKEHRGPSATDHLPGSEERAGCLEDADIVSVKKASAPRPKFAWLVSPKQLHQIDAAKSVGEARWARKGRRDVPECSPIFSEEATEVYDWDGLERGDEQGNVAAGWRAAPAHFGLLQYKEQTAGWHKSLAYLQHVFSEQGPFDGVLGFSQGAAIAAALCSHLGDEVNFRFVILCSGFCIESLAAPLGKVLLPSLHVFGAQQGKDRQIEVTESIKLAEQFEPSQRVVLQHNAGHIVPTSKNCLEQYRTFCKKFLEST